MDASEGRPFGALLRAYRVAAGLSQEELAERARLSRRTISDLERGVTTAPYRGTVELLADALGVSASESAMLEAAVVRARAPATHSASAAGVPDHQSRMADGVALPAGTLTFLIADVRGYTAYTHWHGDAAGAALATRFAQLADEAIRGQEGQVVEARGDEVLAVFTGARKALRAAVDLMARCATAATLDLPLQAGVGLDVGEPMPVPGGYLGEAINMAARLCARAGPGEVLASDAVVSLARRIEGLAYEERGPLELKGIPHPVRAWRVRAEPVSGQEDEQHPHAGTQSGVTAPPPMDALLATKLSIPPARPGLVMRPRLMERLRAGLQGPLTLLSAPAGSGKTTLLSAWRASPQGRGVPLAWVALNEDDNDPPRFWRYVLTALDRAAPFAPEGQIIRSPAAAAPPLGVATAALTLLHSSDAPSMEAVLSALVNAITAHDGDMVLILDDYHLIEATPIHRALAFLLAHLPPRLHLLLATRADPPLPLARLRGRGDVTELRAADLRFTVEETATFLGAVMGLTFSSDEVAALEARTEGWIAGLQLAGLSLQGRSTAEAAAFITAFTGSHRYIVDYLLDEVLLRQPEPVQRFLLHTCILDRLCAPLCAAVLEGEDPPAERIAASHEVLETLERNNVFLIALDDDRRWYRYHYLFADAVRQRQAGDASVPETAVLHRRASAWLERQGLLHEAINHALAGGWYEHGVDLIRRLAPVLGARGEVMTVSTWLQALPEVILQGEPQLSLQYAWLLVDMRDPRGAEKYLGYAEAALESSPRRAPPGQYPVPGTSYPAGDVETVRATIAAGRSIIAAVQGDAARAIPRARAALAGLDGGNVRARSIAGIALGLAYLSQGSAREAADAFKDVAVVNRATDFVLFRTLAAVGEASAHRMAGALDRALAVYDRAIAWSAERSHASPLAGSLYAGLADILRERNELDAALDCATRGVELAQDVGAAQAERWIEWQVCNLLVLARTEQAQGDLDGALAVVQEAREQLEGYGASSFAAILAAFEAQIRLAQGDIEGAVRCLRRVEAHEAPPKFGLTPQIFVYAFEHLEIAPAQVLLAQGRASGDPAHVRRSLAILDGLREKAERSGLVWLHGKALALQALAYQVLGEVAPALAALGQALVLARPAGYVRLFIDEGPHMADVLRELRAHATASDHVAALLAALEGQLQRDVKTAVRPEVGASLRLPLTEPLTERELEVLRLLAGGQSNPEIARTLYVEINTIKTHVKNLYGKLGVHSRVQAVRLARELGLL